MSTTEDRTIGQLRLRVGDLVLFHTHNAAGTAIDLTRDGRGRTWEAATIRGCAIMPWFTLRQKEADHEQHD